MKKTIIALTIFNILAWWLPFGYPEEMNATVLLVRIFVAVMSIIAIVFSISNHIEKTTRKCSSCGNYNDLSDETCTNCKSKL